MTGIPRRCGGRPCAYWAAAAPPAWQFVGAEAVFFLLLATLYFFFRRASRAENLQLWTAVLEFSAIFHFSLESTFFDFPKNIENFKKCF